MAEVEKSFNEFKAVKTEPAPETTTPILESRSADVIAQMGLPLMRAIAALAANDAIVGALAKVKHDDFAALERALLSDIARDEKRFWMMVSQFYAFQQNGGVDILHAEGFGFHQGEDQSSFLARLCVEEYQLVLRAVGDLIERIGGDIAGKTVHIFRCALDATELDRRRPQIEEHVIRAALNGPYQKKGYGAFCEVAPVGNAFGYIIMRGTRRVPTAVLDSDECRKFRHDRGIKTDILFYSPDLHSLIIQCQNKADAPLYAEVFGRALGDPNMFLRRQGFDLAPILNPGLQFLLAKASREVQAVRIELRFAKIKIANGPAIVNSAGRGRLCLTDDSYNKIGFDPSNEALGVKLRIIRSSDGKQWSDLDMTAAGLKIGPGLDPLSASSVLRALGMWPAYADC